METLFCHWLYLPKHPKQSPKELQLANCNLRTFKLSMWVIKHLILNSWFIATHKKKTDMNVVVLARGGLSTSCSIKPRRTKMGMENWFKEFLEVNGSSLYWIGLQRTFAARRICSDTICIPCLTSHLGFWQAYQWQRVGLQGAVSSSPYPPKEEPCLKPKSN